MKRSTIQLMIVLACLIAVAATASAQQHIQAPQPTVPEIYTLEGEFIRVAYNNEGWVTLGYRTANDAQGEQWMLLEVGLTVMDKKFQQDLAREAFNLKLPDESLVPLATQKEYQATGYLKSLNRMADHSKDSVAYFPPKADRPCQIPLFSTPGQSTMAVDKFEANWLRGCLGRLYFKLPEDTTIQPGQHWLVVKFQNSSVEVPFKILTEEEGKFLSKNWKDIKTEYEAYLKQQAEKAHQK